MKWCRQCVLPDTRPNLVIGPDGICNACSTHGRKSEIDWGQRAEAFKAVCAAAKARARPNGWDCIIPVSGGKDSTWQTIVCLEHGLKPLALSWRPPGRTPLGRANLDNLIRLGVDHIDWSINPKIEASLMLRSLQRFGSTAIPMHMAIFAMPLTAAVRFDIPLIVWGENSAFEYGSEDESLKGFALDEAWLKKFGVTHGTKAADWIGDGVTMKDMASYFAPNEDDLARADIKAVFLGHYFKWSPEETARVAAQNGFKSAIDGPRVGAWTFADLDDDFISLHHWMKWMKFGFGRAFDNLSVDIRNGRISRDEAIARLRTIGDDTPDDDIDKFCVFSGIDRERFFSLAERWRNTDIWRQDASGQWMIPDFLISDWPWPKRV